MVKPVRGAELCALAGQGRYAFGSAVDYRRCAALHRRWIAPVNWCASNPDRSRARIRHASQCTGAASTYVTLTEREGQYDECLTSRRVRELQRLARRENTTLKHEALARSPRLCGYRPRHLFTGGRCVRGVRPDATPGGTLLIGDSIAWRGTDELGQIRRNFTLDGIPSRRLDSLEPRLDWFRLDHGDPTGLIVELGTNAVRNFAKHDLRHILWSLPAETTVMLVLPYRSNPHAPPKILPASTRYAAWMRELAHDRADTCVADWRAYVAHNPAVLVDGVHPTSAGERVWARWISRAWSTCMRHG